MNACSAFGEELSDVALGSAPSEALSAHLAQCSACTALLARQRALAARMDAAVHALVSTQPERLPENIVARIRFARPQSQHQNRPWAGIAACAAIAASLALIFGLRGWEPHAPTGANVIGITQWHSPTAALLEPQGSILHSPLRDRWFDPATRPSHSEPSPGETHGT